jgi:hypothetical protein
MALYGDAVRGSSRGINCLLGIAQLTPTDGMNDRILWSPAFPAEGKLLRLNLGEWDRVLAIARQSDSLFSAGRPLVRRGDLEALRFTANLYEVTARLRFRVRDASQLYARAITWGKSDKEKCGSDLLLAAEILAALQQEYSSLKNRYAALWLRENRTYALDSVEHSYDRRIDDLRDVEHRVQAALADFETGKPLPPPQAVRLATVESDGWYLRDWLIAGPIGGNRHLILRRPISLSNSPE